MVERTPDDTGKIFFGAWVTLEDESGEETRWRIVGPDEFDLSRGKLSMDSPLARALLGKRLDDEIRVHSPSGEQLYYVTDIAITLHHDALPGITRAAHAARHRDHQNCHCTPTDAVNGLFGRAPSGWRATMRCSSNTFSTFR